MASYYMNTFVDNKVVRIVGLFVLLSTAIVFYIVTEMNAPGPYTADGVYKNSCCADITIARGFVSQSGKTLKMKLRQMKFGLTGYVNAKFTKDGMRESKEETAVSFFTDKGRRALRVTIDDEYQTFKDDDDATSNKPSKR